MSYKKLLTFAIGSYLMLRIDYVVICRDELEAKILRIIEMYMEMERARIYQETVNGSTGETDEDIEITKDIWVAISHRLFTRDLYQLVKSANTLKRAIKSLADKGFIFIRPGTGKHDPILYQLNTAKLQAEFEKLSQLGIVGYQKLIPSKIDTSKSDTHEGSKNRHHQTLTPSKNDPHSRIVSSSRIDGTSSNGNEEEGTGATAPTPPPIIDFEARKSESDARLKAVTPSGKHPVVDVNATFASQGIDPEETVRHPAIRVNVKPQGDNNHAAVHDAGNSDAGAGGSLPGHTDADRVPAHPGAAAHLAAAYAAHGDTRGDRLAVPAATPAAAKEPPDTSLDACSGPLFSGHDGAAPPAGVGTLSPSANASQPRASEASHHMTGSGDMVDKPQRVFPPSSDEETPRQLTRKQQDKLHDSIKAEYWSVIEQWKGATYTRDQRASSSHTSGIEAMLANGILPDDLKIKLGKLDAFQRRTFTVNKLYLDWWNNLDEQAPAKPTNGKARGKSRTAYDGQTDLDTYGFGQNDEAQIAKFTKLGAAS